MISTTSDRVRPLTVGLGRTVPQANTIRAWSTRFGRYASSESVRRRGVVVPLLMCCAGGEHWIPPVCPREHGVMVITLEGYRAWCRRLPIESSSGHRQCEVDQFPVVGSKLPYGWSAGPGFGDRSFQQPNPCALV